MGRSRDKSRYEKPKRCWIELALQVNIPFTNDEGFEVIDELRKAHAVDRYSGSVQKICDNLQCK